MGRLLGAGDGNRTHLTSLGSSSNNHYTTPARTLNITEELDDAHLNFFIFLMSAFGQKRSFAAEPHNEVTATDREQLQCLVMLLHCPTKRKHKQEMSQRPLLRLRQHDQKSLQKIMPTTLTV